MKIKKVGYSNGEALFVLEEFPDLTICIKLDHNKTTTKDVIDELKLKLPKQDNTEQKYNDLKLKELEGTNI